MATRDDVLDAIHRIEAAGGGGPATRAAVAALTMPLPPGGYDQVLSQLKAAYPAILGAGPQAGPQQQGRSIQAIKDAEGALAHQLSTTAEFDRQILEALVHAGAGTVEGRARLDGLEQEIVNAARGWDLTTPLGAREFQRFLVGKLGEITRVVEESDGDAKAKQALAAALAALYSAQGSSDGPATAPRDGAGANPAPTVPAAAGSPGGAGDVAGPADLGGAADGEYLDDLPIDESQPGYQPAPWSGPPPAAVPSGSPGFGGDLPGMGAMPAAGAGGLPLAGLLSGLRRADPDLDGHDPGDPGESGEPTGVANDDDVPPDGEADDGAVPAPAPAGPVTVRLPDGATTSVADPRVAAAMQAVVGGTPVTEAFHRQGIDVPAPGTPVTSPVDPSRLRPGDIGVLTDRHALAVGDSRALLDGQLQYVANVRGPGFLGWLHPPGSSAGPDPGALPEPTRPATAPLPLRA